MKLLQTSTLLALLFISVSVTAQRITGKGQLIAKTHQINSFNKLELEGVFNIILKQGIVNQVVVEAQKNLHQYIVIDESSNKLHLHFTKELNLKKHKSITITITFTNLEQIKSSIVGNIKSEGTLHLESLAIDNSSVGNFNIDLVANSLDAELSAVGNITFSGAVQKVNIQNSIVGNLKAKDLEAASLEINNSSVGNVHVTATEEIYINHSGIGNLHYYGDAAVKELSSTGIGKVKSN